jgi:uncharacterized protein
MQLNNTSHFGPVDVSKSPFTALYPFRYDQTHITGGFWGEKRHVNRLVSLRHGYEMMEKAGNFHNLGLAAGVAAGSYRGRNFLDSDVYKWLEAVAWELGSQTDPALIVMVDYAITLIEQAQSPDGYLNSYYQVVEPEQHWRDLDHGHELYCAGHLFQAAVAFHRALNDSRLLAVACRFADHICSTFGPQGIEGTCGHPEIEMALVELYRTTETERYLEMAQFFVEQRGKNRLRGLGPYGPEYHQDHAAVKDVHEASGHTVRQLYLAAGVTDLVLESGDSDYQAAMQRLWQDITQTKLYITGGTGARFDGEAFGDPYELPSDQCYCEACSAIALFMWNWRMLLSSGDSRFADQMELALYNSVLSSPALDGKHFFYINPLMLRDAKYLRLSCNPPPESGFIPHQRPEWHSVACCPPNIMRLFASLSHYLATSSAGGIQIHHYAPLHLVHDTTHLKIETQYPWHEQIKATILNSAPASWKLALRIPAWCPGFRLEINGEVMQPDIERGYAAIERQWQAGDKICLDLEIEPTVIASNPRIDATRSSLAIQRGPLIYCLEAVDQQFPGRMMDIEIDPSQPLQETWREELLGGIMLVQAAGELVEPGSWQGKLYQPLDQVQANSRQEITLTAIPYFLWGNRGIGPMRVWIPYHPGKHL